MTKRFVMAILAMLVVISTAGCGGSSTKNESGSSNGNSSTEPASKVKELVVYSSVMKEEALKEMFKGFTEETGVKIKPRFIKSEEFVQAFMVAANGGSPIDLLVLNGQDVKSFVQKGLVKDISSFDFKDRFLDNAIAQATFNGSLYGLPAKGGNSSGIYINKDVLDQYGLEVPKTLDDMIAVNNTLKQNKKSFFAFGGGNKYMWPMWLFSVYAQTSGNQSLEKTEAILKGKAKFTDADYVEALSIVQTFAKEDMFQKGFIGADADGGKSEFINGNTAAFFGGTWEISDLRKAGLKNLELIEFPIVKQGATSQQTGSAFDGVYSIYSKIDPAKEEMAKKALEYVTRDENIKKFRESTTKSVSENFVFTSSKNVPLPDNADVLAKKTQEDLYPVTVTFLDWIYPPEITQTLQDGMQELMGQQKTPEQVAAALQAKMDELIANGYDPDAVK